MKTIAVVLLLAGCAGNIPPPVNPTPNPSVQDALAKVQETVAVVSRVIGMICELEGQSPVCTTLADSLRVVTFASSKAESLYETYLRTGVGLELVQSAIEDVFASLNTLNVNAAVARSMLTYGMHNSSDSSARATARGPTAESSIAAPPLIRDPDSESPSAPCAE